MQRKPDIITPARIAACDQQSITHANRDMNDTRRRRQRAYTHITKQMDERVDEAADENDPERRLP